MPAKQTQRTGTYEELCIAMRKVGWMNDPVGKVLKARGSYSNITVALKDSATYAAYLAGPTPAFPTTGTRRATLHVPGDTKPQDAKVPVEVHEESGLVCNSDSGKVGMLADLREAIR